MMANDGQQWLIMANDEGSQIRGTLVMCVCDC